MWSFVQKKENQRRLWHAIDHSSEKVVADVLGGHRDTMFLKLRQVLEAFETASFIQMDRELINES